MALVKIKDKFQVTIPTEVRDQVPLAVGDLMDVTLHKGAILMKPKAVVDRAVEAAIGEGLADHRAGRVTGKFKTVKEFKARLAR